MNKKTNYFTAQIQELSMCAFGNESLTMLDIDYYIAIGRNARGMTRAKFMGMNLDGQSLPIICWN